MNMGKPSFSDSAVPVLKAPPKEDKDKDKNDKDEDSDVDSRFVLDATVPNGNFKPTVEGPKLPARNKLSFNQMSSNYGKGFAMLQKMGFTGGGGFVLKTPSSKHCLLKRSIPWHGYVIYHL